VTISVNSHSLSSFPPNVTVYSVLLRRGLSEGKSLSHVDTHHTRVSTVLFVRGNVYWSFAGFITERFFCLTGCITMWLPYYSVMSRFLSVYRNCCVPHSVRHMLRGYFKKKRYILRVISKSMLFPRFPRRGRLWLCRRGFHESVLLRRS